MTLPPLHAALERAVKFERDGKFFEAESLYRQLTQMAQPPELAHLMYAHFKLMHGDYLDAWPHFMHRLADPYYRDRPSTGIAKPMMSDPNSPDAAGQTILVHMDEGMGDAIMCARYLPLLAERFKHVIFQVYAGCRQFFEMVDPRIEVAEDATDLSEFDLHTHLFNLPALFQTEVETIPPAHCFSVPDDLSQAWRKRLTEPGLKVGLVWQGAPKHPRDNERSLPLSALIPLLKTDGVSFYSLQAGDSVEQIGALEEEVSITPLHDDLTRLGDMSDARFTQTAAAIDNLDIVVTIDSVLSHLSGALGKPTWVLLSRVPDWRWMLDRDDSVWYPTARLFRCRERFGWDEPVAAMAKALAEEAARR